MSIDYGGSDDSDSFGSKIIQEIEEEAD